jgi:two-component system, sensor histidine kinase
MARQQMHETDLSSAHALLPSPDPGTAAAVDSRLTDLEEELRRARAQWRETTQELADTKALLSVTQEQLARTRQEARARDTGHQQTETHLHDAARHKDAYLTMLAHELRNPLAPLRNAVQVMRGLDELDPQLVELREIIDRQVDHMAHMLDGLLDIAHIACGKLQLEPQKLDLAALTRQTAEDFRGIVESGGLTLDVRAPAEPLWVWGDPTRLMQVFGNLLRNAMKFTATGGQIRITVVREGEAVTIQVSDTGIGMTPESITRVFDPFHQEQGPSRRPGLGLGLALVKGLVELHGGTVRAISPGLGLGSTLCFSLPLMELAADEFAETAVALSPSTSLRILVIDDLRDTTDTLQLLLEHEGHHVAVAYAGEEALNVARQFRPQAVLCDIDLADAMDGYAIASALRDDPVLRTAHLIAITGYGHAQSRLEAQAAGFDDHLLKPVSMETLTAVLAAGRKGKD